MTIKELLAARTAPGKWEVSEDDEYVCVTMDGPDDYTPLGYPDERNTADARAIVAMDHIIDPALAVVEAARARFDAVEPFLYDYPMSQDERQHTSALNPVTFWSKRMWERLRETTIAYREALAAFDAAVEEATR